MKNISRYQFFGFVFVKKRQYDELVESEKEALLKRADLSADNHRLRNEVQALMIERDNLKQEVEEYRSTNALSDIINIFVGDPEPVDTEQRKLYVAGVAGLHKTILEPKLKSMLSKTFLLLEPSDNDRDYDQAVKGAIYFGRELLRWGERMVNEQIAYQTQVDDNK